MFTWRISVDWKVPIFSLWSVFTIQDSNVKASHSNTAVDVRSSTSTQLVRYCNPSKVICHLQTQHLELPVSQTDRQTDRPATADRHAHTHTPTKDPPTCQPASLCQTVSRSDQFPEHKLLVCPSDITSFCNQKRPWENCRFNGWTELTTYSNQAPESQWRHPVYHLVL